MMTLATARAKFVNQATKTGDPYAADVLENINSVMERFQTMGKWKSCFVEIALTVYDGVVTLPRHCQSMMFYRKNNAPIAIKNQWFEWLQFGLGFREVDKCMSFAFDQGSRFCSFRDFAAPRKLRAKAMSGDDATIAVVFQGTTADGRRVYTDEPPATHPVNGAKVTLSGGVGTTTELFAAFEGFSKPATHDYVEIWTVNPVDSSDETLIALYEPGEIAPQYRRYKVGPLEGTDTMHAICKLQYVPLASDMDMLFPSNTGAIKNGLLALSFEDQAELEKSDGYWARAFGILNSELAQERGGANAPVVFNFDGGRQPKIGAMM